MDLLKEKKPFVGFYAESHAQASRYKRAARLAKRSLSDWIRIALDREAREQLERLRNHE